MTHEGVRMYDQRPSIKRNIESLWVGGKGTKTIAALLNCDQRYVDYVVQIFASRPAALDQSVGDHVEHVESIFHASKGRGFPVLRIEYPRRAA